MMAQPIGMRAGNTGGIPCLVEVGNGRKLRPQRTAARPTRREGFDENWAVAGAAALDGFGRGRMNGAHVGAVDFLTMDAVGGGQAGKAVGGGRRGWVAALLRPHGAGRVVLADIDDR